MQNDLHEAVARYTKLIKTSYREDFERIHADAIEGFCDGHRYLTAYETDVESEKQVIQKRLVILDSRIDTFKLNPISWPERFEARLLEIVRDSRSVDDLEYNLKNILESQRNEFIELIKAYRELRKSYLN